MNAVALDFPVICFFRDHTVETRDDWDSVATGNKYALKKRAWDGMLIVDCNGQAVRVKTATKLHGVGKFWGYNIFLNQRIRVELTLDGEPFRVSLEDVKKLLFRSFTALPSIWQANLDYEEFTENIKNARAISEIAMHLRSGV